LWDPQQDVWKLMQDFADGYYGEADKPIMQYLHLLHDKIKTDNIHLHLYESPTAVAYLKGDIVDRAEQLFQQAEDAVTSRPELLARVQKARLAIDYTRLSQAQDDTERKKYARIVADKIERFNIGEISEAKSAKEYAKTILGK
jgi:hypothetical protein